MVSQISASGRSQKSGEGWPYQILPAKMGENLFALARQYSGLVYQPTALVGAPHSSLV